MAFNMISQKLIDAWLSHEDPTPQQLFHAVAPRLSVRARLSTIELTGDDPADWYLRPIRHSAIETRLIDLNRVFRQGRIGDIVDPAFVETSVIPQYRRVIESRQPAIDTVRGRLLGLTVVYDRIILPQKATIPSWLLTCTWGRFMMPLPKKTPVLDDIDQSIYLLLVDGASAKEIATALNLSNRTIEHRIEKMKKQTGAKNITNLVALISAAGIQGAVEFAVDGRV